MIRGLFIMAPSLTLNPTLDPERIAAEIAEDPEAGRSEWGGQFRSDLTQYLPDELLDRAVISGRLELPPMQDRNYVAFCDPSGGRHDDMTLAIAHQEADARLLLDHLTIQRPPFDPETVTRHFAETLKRYRQARTLGDAYAASWVQTAFAKHGIRYEPAELDKSALYVEALPLFAQGRVELLDVRPMILQFRLLERRPRAGGKGDLVDHPSRSHDDAANAVAGALWHASRRPAIGTQIRPIVHSQRWDPMDRSTWARALGPPSKVYQPTPAERARAIRGQLECLSVDLARYREQGHERGQQRTQRRIDAFQRQLSEIEKVPA